MATQSADDPYATLGVSRDASREEVTRAYRNRAKRVHPDHGGSAGEFNRLRTAYETLVDPATGRDSDEPDPWDAPSWTTAPARERRRPSRHQGIGDADDVIIDADVDDRSSFPPPPPLSQPETGRRWPPDLGFPAPPTQPVYIMRTNRLAVWAFALSLFPVVYWQPVALALGVLAKVQIDRSGGIQRGGKRATFAIAVSLLVLALRVL